MISDRELYDLYTDTLERAGLHLLDKEKKWVEYEVFEQFHNGAVSFLHHDSVLRLQQAGLISTQKMEKSLELRSTYFDVMNSETWDYERFKTSKKWHELMHLCDEIRKMD